MARVRAKPASANVLGSGTGSALNPAKLSALGVPLDVTRPSDHPDTSSAGARPVKRVARPGGWSDANGEDEVQGQAYGLATDPLISLYNLLYRQLDQNVGYPEEFKTALIAGVVEGKLVFSSEGKYQPEASSFKSEDRYLRIHVLRAVQRAFREAIPRTFWTIDHALEIRCRFRFAITENNDEREAAAPKFFAGRMMTFYRHYFHSKLQYDVGPIHGMYGIPAVGIDPTWFVKKSKELLSGDAKIEPLQRYEADPEF